jgi:hypothetical protein
MQIERNRSKLALDLKRQNELRKEHGMEPMPQDVIR